MTSDRPDRPTTTTSEGGPVDPAPDPPVCANCGGEIGQEDVVCPHCGVSLAGG